MDLYVNRCPVFYQAGRYFFYMQESDMFSVGVVIWELWAATPPWPGLTPPQLGRALVRDGQRLPISNKHNLVALLLKTCFGPPMARLPAAQVNNEYVPLVLMLCSYLSVCLQLLSQVNYLKMVQFYD